MADNNSHASPQLTLSRPTIAMMFTVLCALGALTVGIVLLNRAAHIPDQPIGAGPPAGVRSDGSIVVGPQTTVRVDYYYDYLCSTCQNYEKGLLKTARDMQRAGFAHINYHPLVRYDLKEPEGDYSSRAAGAAYCVANDSPGAFSQFHEALIAHMPTSAKPGLRNSAISDLAQQAGADVSVRACVTQDRYEPFARAMTAQAALTGVGEVPVMFIGGQPIPEGLRTEKGLRALILLEAGLLEESKLPWQENVSRPDWLVPADEAGRKVG